MHYHLRFSCCAVLPLVLAACGGPPSTGNPQSGQLQGSQTGGPVGPPLSTKNMPAVIGQKQTCTGPREKSFDVDVIETPGVEIGMGMTFAAWAYNGHLPGPTIEACQGDIVTLNVHNKGTTSHGLDTHAFKIDARKYGPTPPGTTLKIVNIVLVPLVFALVALLVWLWRRRRRAPPANVPEVAAEAHP